MVSSELEALAKELYDAAPDNEAHKVFIAFDNFERPESVSWEGAKQYRPTGHIVKNTYEQAQKLLDARKSAQAEPKLTPAPAPSPSPKVKEASKNTIDTGAYYSSRPNTIVLTDEGSDFEENIVDYEIGDDGMVNLWFAPTYSKRHREDDKGLCINIDDIDGLVYYLKKMQRKMIEVKYGVELK